MTNYIIIQVIAMFLIPFLCILLPILIGQHYGLNLKLKSGKISESPVGSVVGTSLGLLAFMLAFTFQIVDNRYNSRKELLLDEVTTIRTTYLRAGLIPEPYKSNTRKLLVEYTDLRGAIVNDVSIDKVEKLKTRSQSILDILWGYSESLAAQDRSSEAYSLYITSVDDLVDIYNKRITLTFQYRIPIGILCVLFIISFFSMLLLGYQFGISGRKIHD